MVVLSQLDVLDHKYFSQISTCKFHTGSFYDGIPVIDLLNPDAKTQIVNACQEFGFFKVINHGIPFEVMTGLETEAVKFFKLPQQEKEKVASACPFGYGNKTIGRNGDMGWLEYLLFHSDPQFAYQKAIAIPGDSELFWSCFNAHVSAVRNMACEVLEMIADGLKIEPRNVLSKMLKDEKSDALFRLNHYPPCPELHAFSGRNVIGFAEHTDPQIISVIKSNNTSGLQISLRDGSWVSVPPDQYSFFINVGDSLQVMTNGRFRSVKHRVVADGLKSRVSMIYFGGPPPNEKIAPFSSVMEEGEESLYKEFTWSEYQRSACKTRLGENRLRLFEKSAAAFGQ